MGAILSVFRKEMIDHLRDKRSILVAMIYPLMGPLLLGLMFTFVGGTMRVSDSGPLVVPIVNFHSAPDLVRFLEKAGAVGPEIERMVTQALTSPHGAVLDPGVADTLTRQASDMARRQEDKGHPACLLVPDALRAPLARLLKRAAPRLKVLAHSEIPETHSIRIGSIIGGTA